MLQNKIRKHRTRIHIYYVLKQKDLSMFDLYYNGFAILHRNVRILMIHTIYDTTLRIYILTTHHRIKINQVKLERVFLLLEKNNNNSVMGIRITRDSRNNRPQDSSIKTTLRDSWPCVHHRFFHRRTERCI